MLVGSVSFGDIRRANSAKVEFTKTTNLHADMGTIAACSPPQHLSRTHNPDAGTGFKLGRTSSVSSSWSSLGGQPAVDTGPSKRLLLRPMQTRLWRSEKRPVEGKSVGIRGLDNTRYSQKVVS